MPPDCSMQTRSAGVVSFISSTNAVTRRRVVDLRRGWRRQRLPPPTAAGASASSSGGSDSSSGASGSKSRHFLRPSLLEKLGAERGPSDVVQHCLALFRKADLAGLQQYLPEGYQAASQQPQEPQQQQQPPPDGGSNPSSGASTTTTTTSSSSSSDGGAAARPALPVGPDIAVVESGPLATLAGVLDVAARRVLPGHLLRRSQVLSTLRLGDSFQQRIALTACTGETSVFQWQLRWEPDGTAGAKEQEAGQASTSGSSGHDDSASNATVGSGSSRAGRWVVESVRRDPDSDEPLPTTPHPKASPESVVLAQLESLRSGDILNASCFSMAHGKGISSRRTGLAFHHEALRNQLLQEPYQPLLDHKAVRLGAAALPGQREMLQEVSVLAADGSSATFLFRLGMQSHGCWMVSGIFAVGLASED